MKRGKRGPKKPKSNFKQNMQTLGIKTTGVVFGIPHFVVNLVGHEIAQTEAMVNFLIQRKDLDYYTNRRKMLSESYRQTMEDGIDQAIQTTGQAIGKAGSKIKGAFKRKPEAPQGEQPSQA